MTLRIDVLSYQDTPSQSRTLSSEREEQTIITLDTMATSKEPSNQGIILGGFTILDEIASGEFSVVCLASRNDGKKYVAKRLLHKKIGLTEAVPLIIAATTIPEHENIVRLYEVFINPSKPVAYIVSDFAGVLSLNEAILGHQGEERDKQGYIEDLTKGLSFLHGNGIVHGDLRPQNVLMVEGVTRRKCKLADFAVCRIQETHSEMSKTKNIRKSFQAPDFEEAYTEGNDIFALGAVMYVIFEELSVTISKKQYLLAATVLQNQTVPLSYLVKQEQLSALNFSNKAVSDELASIIKELLTPRQSKLKDINDVKAKILKAVSLKSNNIRETDDLLPSINKIKEIHTKLSTNYDEIENYVTKPSHGNTRTLQRESRLLKDCIQKVEPVMKLCSIFRDKMASGANSTEKEKAAQAVRESIKMFEKSGIESQIEETLERVVKLKLTDLPAPDLDGSKAHQQLEARLETFGTWPLNEVIDPLEMAQLGFYFTGEDEIVKCFSCGLRLTGLQRGDSPRALHSQYSPRCIMVQSDERTESTHM